MVRHSAKKFTPSPLLLLEKRIWKNEQPRSTHVWSLYSFQWRHHGLCGRVGLCYRRRPHNFQGARMTTYISAATRNTPVENEGDNYENRSDRRYWTHWIKARQQVT